MIKNAALTKALKGGAETEYRFLVELEIEGQPNMQVSRTTASATWSAVEKWLGIWQGTGEDRGRLNCQLCHLYIDKDPPCSGCPVYLTTGAIYCWKTPYTMWAKVAERELATMWARVAEREMAGSYEFPTVVKTEAQKVLAEREYRFLVELALSLEIEKQHTHLTKSNKSLAIT